MDTLATLRATKTENIQLKDRFQKVCTHTHAHMHAHEHMHARACVNVLLRETCHIMSEMLRQTAEQLTLLLLKLSLCTNVIRRHWTL